jgi:hypothetical protein
MLNYALGRMNVASLRECLPQSRTCIAAMLLAIGVTGSALAENKKSAPAPARAAPTPHVQAPAAPGGGGAHPTFGGGGAAGAHPAAKDPAHPFGQAPGAAAGAHPFGQAPGAAAGAHPFGQAPGAAAAHPFGQGPAAAHQPERTLEAHGPEPRGGRTAGGMPPAGTPGRMGADLHPGPAGTPRSPVQPAGVHPPQPPKPANVHSPSEFHRPTLVQSHARASPRDRARAMPISWPM